jgi:hypothetical protein
MESRSVQDLERPKEATRSEDISEWDSLSEEAFKGSSTMKVPIPEKSHHRVCFDFDGVLAEDVWPKVAVGEPIEKGLAMLRSYQKQGYEIVIYTSRPKSHENIIRLFLAFQDLSDVVYDITFEKPIAGIYIDDRGFRFEREGG